MGKIPQIKKLEGVIKGLVRELEQLGPNPDQISSLSGLFGLQASADLPRRMGLERRINSCRRRIASLQKDEIFEELALAA